MESLRVPVFSSTIRAMAGIAACVVLGAALFRSPSAVGADTDGTVDATELDASFPAFYGRGLSVFVKGNPDPEAQTDYEWWTDLLARRAMTSWSFDSKPLPLKLVVSAVTGDDKPRRDPVASFLTGIHVEGVEVATNDFVGQINQHDRWDELKFSPDGRTVAAIRTRGCAMLDIATWRDLFEIAEPRMGERHLPFSSPQFTPDGRYLLLRTREPALRVYDATTGKPAERPPYIPAEAVAFVQAPRQPRAVVQSPSATYLWDTDLLRVIAPLDETGDLSGVAFSPDESRAALSFVPKRGSRREHRICVIKTEHVVLLRILRPFAQDRCEMARDLTWSPDGQYLLAVTKARVNTTFPEISVWNVATGRHRGVFVGFDSRLNGIGLLANGQLAASSDDGKIRLWDFAGNLRQICEFAASLTGAPALPRP